MLGQRQQSSVEPCELSVLEEQQDFHAQAIVDVGSLYRLVRSYQQGMKENHISILIQASNFKHR